MQCRVHRRERANDWRPQAHDQERAHYSAQEVKCDRGRCQSVGQRMLGVGDLSIETAGENSRLVVENLDSPQQLAEQITDLAGHAPASGVQ